jgi:hypothetical protein
MATFGGGINLKTKEWLALRERGTYVSKLPANWDSQDVPDWARYIAVDEDGSEWLYEYEPIKHGNRWLASEGMCIPRFRTCSNWDKTLIQRKVIPVKVFGEELKKIRKQRARDKKKAKNKAKRIASKLEKYGVDKVTETRFGEFYIKRLIQWTQPNGKQVYVSHINGNTCDNHRSYKFTPLKRGAKLYVTEKSATKAMNNVFDRNGIPLEELDIITQIYKKTEDGKYVMAHNNTMVKYKSYLEDQQLEKENNNGREMAGNITDEETQSDKHEN